jgi:hypothetical protein
LTEPQETCEPITRKAIICVIGILEEEKEGRTEKEFKEIMAETFQI